MWTLHLNTEAELKWAANYMIDRRIPFRFVGIGPGGAGGLVGEIELDDGGRLREMQRALAEYRKGGGK